jgi:cyclase
MLAKRIIPCLDVKDGRVVKGVSFVSLRDAGDPVLLARTYDREGADELVFLDITASKEKRDIMLKVVQDVAKEVFIPFTVGGGIKSLKDMEDLLMAGADKVSINTSAVFDPKIITEGATTFGRQFMVVAIDAKRDGKSFRVFTHGGSRPTELNAIEWAKEVEDRGAGEILLTSMDQDGRKTGYDIELTKEISDAVNIPVIASGGAGTIDHVIEAFKKTRATAALLASVLHFGEIRIKDIKIAMQREKIPVRLDW